MPVIKSDHRLRTYSGRNVDLLNPHPSDISIQDIAHSLSLLNRYNGHSIKGYSVATHSLHVSRLVPRGLELHGLLHDAAEAYLGDVVRPLKHFLTGYEPIESKFETAIWECFGLSWDPQTFIAVKRADNLALRTEWGFLFPHDGYAKDDPTGTFSGDEAAAVAGGLRPCRYSDSHYWRGPQSALHAEASFLLRFGRLTAVVVES
jgi:hypothetical protein